MYYLYIIKSLKRKYIYTGVTDNLERRLFEHNSGRNKTTKFYHPFLLIHKEEFITLSEARKREWFYKCTPQGGKLKRKFLTMAGPYVFDRDPGRRPREVAVPRVPGSRPLEA